MSDIQLATKDVNQFEQKALAVLELARNLVVTTREQATHADAFVASLRAYEKELDATFDDSIEAANKAHKTALAAKKKHAGPILEAKDIANGKLAVFMADEKKRAEVERLRLEAEAKKKAQDDALNKAVALEAAGKVAQAEKVISAPVRAAPVFVMPFKLANSSSTRRHTATLQSLEDVIKAAAGGNLVALSFLEFNQPTANKFAIATKGAIPVPGVLFETKDGMRAA